MHFNELTSEQRRQFVDAMQVFEAHQVASAKWQRSYRGSMRWVTRKGHDYLHRKQNKRERSLGRRSADTETQFNAFHNGRDKLRGELKQLSTRLDEMAPVNRALQLGRIPTIAARIMRSLESNQVLSTHLVMVGTNALFAYEAKAGVFLGQEFVATGDADLLWDARQSIALLAPEVRRLGIIGLLQKLDQSFQARGANDFRAFNKDGYFVDLIRPDDSNFFREGRSKTMGDRKDDLEASPIFGLQWLVTSPRFETVSIGQDGYPVLLVTVDPRAFALHKLWISENPKRDPIKRRRDRSQAAVVAELCHRYFNLNFETAELGALPEELRRGIKQLSPEVVATGEEMPEPNW